MALTKKEVRYVFWFESIDATNDTDKITRVKDALEKLLGPEGKKWTVVFGVRVPQLVTIE